MTDTVVCVVKLLLFKRPKYNFTRCLLFVADDQLGLPQDHTTSEKCTISINSDLQGKQHTVVRT